MLHCIASSIAEEIMKRANVPKTQRAVFVYGCELLLSTCASAFSVIVLSILMNAVYSSFAFLFVFMGIRLFSGGYHAKTYLHCFLLTNLIYMATFLASRIISKYIGNVGDITLVCAAAGIIIVLAPIRHKKHPLSAEAYRKNTYIARIITVVITSGSVFLLAVKGSDSVLSMIVVTLTAVAVMMIIPKISEQEECKND